MAIGKKIILIVFLIIFALGFFFRIWDLDKNPAGFFCDEASIGYNAYQILKTGQDEYGVKLPLYFQAFGEYKPPLAIYPAIVPIFFLGLNEFSVRLISVIFSTLTLGVVFLIGVIWADQLLGLILMMILALSPWAIHLSRINLDGFNILIFLLGLSILFLSNFLKNNDDSRSLILSQVFLTLGSYGYSAAKLIFPLFSLAAIALAFLTTKKKKATAAALIIFCVLLLPLVFHLMSGEGLVRFQQVSVFQNKDINPWSKIIHSYWLHFSPDFLFLKGDMGMTGQFISRHSINGIGELYLWQLPFLLIGLMAFFKKKRIFFWPVFFLLLVYPIPSSISSDLTPFATRSLIGILPLTFFSGYGLYFSYLMVKKQKHNQKLFQLCLLVSISVIALSTFDWFKKWQDYPSYSSGFYGWQYGPKQIMNYFLSEKNNYDELYLSGSFNAPGIFLKFYDPEANCRNCFIGGLDDYKSGKKQLFAVRAEEMGVVKVPVILKKTIYYPDGNEAFYILAH